MTKIYRIKELSDLTTVTIRTLHYYDQIELLTPSFKSQHGHRFYSEEDLFRLQQITTLKFLGFSLEQIQQIVTNRKFKLHESLRIQAKIISDEAVRLKYAANLLRTLVNQIEMDKAIDWQILIKITEVLQMGKISKKEWHEKYLSSPELKELEAIQKRYANDFWDLYQNKWNALYKEVTDNLHTAPDSPTGMLLAKKWLNLVDEVYPSDSALRKKLWEACKVGVHPKEGLPHQDVINYIAKATEIYKRQPNPLN